MIQKEECPYGCWKSPINGQSLVTDSLRLGQIQISADRVFWTEGRPAEQGRTALMSWQPATGLREISPADRDVRSRVHEYGGAAFLVSGNRQFIVNNADQQVYELLDGSQVRQITQTPGIRFADVCLDESRNCLYLVAEDHTQPGTVTNSVVRVHLDGSGKLETVDEGHDFYSNPRVSPDGTQLLFLAWDHPNMPWDGTRLYCGSLNPQGALNNIDMIAGSEQISIFQPLWDPKGEIYFISDESGWWNIYRFDNGQTDCLLEMAAEFGRPQWVFGMSTYAVLGPGLLIATYKRLGETHLIHIDAKHRTAEEIPTSYSEIEQLKGCGDHIAFLGSTVYGPDEIVVMQFSNLEAVAVQSASQVTLTPENISKPRDLEFESRQAEMGHAWYYPPLNTAFKGSPGEKPPLIVLSHGGPTSYSSASFNLAIQFWTTRGFAVVDVNYSGSTGYGRQYRERLKGQWGIRDVEDCIAAAQTLVDDGLVDGERLIIKGGSAGGYTTLAALTFHDVFTAGASYYGVGDLELLAKDTHKFESRYLDGLVGQYPEQQQRYHDRSPLNFTHRLNCPVIFFQGLDDPVVPPNQAERMVAALQTQGIPVAYIPFAGEAHGFRQAANIARAIESEYAFYVRVFGLHAQGELEPVDIVNL